MWDKIALGIIRFRLPLMIAIGLITIFMGYYASKVQMSYDFARTVPLDDPDMVFLTKFKEQFGEDGNIIAIGLQDSSLYQLDNFNRFRELNQAFKEISGVTAVLSLPALKTIQKDTAKSKFYLSELFPKEIKSQTELDSLLLSLRNQKLYFSQLMNENNGATRMLISVQIGSARREM